MNTRSVPELLFDRYTQIAPELLGGFLECFMAVRAHFGGDLEQFIIFLTVAIRTAEDPRMKALSAHAVRRGEVSAYPSLLTNVSSIAASSSIPKETVRRKVERMVEKGWFTRRDGALALTVEGSVAFKPLREQLFQLMASHHRMVDELLARAEARQA